MLEASVSFLLWLIVDKSIKTFFFLKELKKKTLTLNTGQNNGHSNPLKSSQQCCRTVKIICQDKLHTTTLLLHHISEKNDIWMWHVLGENLPKVQFR